MNEYIHKGNNVTVLLYRLVFPAKYRRVVFDGQVGEVLKEMCLEIELRYEIKFLEIGTDRDYVHFLVQSVPTYKAIAPKLMMDILVIALCAALVGQMIGSRWCSSSTLFRRFFDCHRPTDQ